MIGQFQILKNFGGNFIIKKRILEDSLFNLDS